ncbi:MAG TPA: hypothetical protein VFG47_06545 [Geminicoccaceae bacterium]|nr:hypothetical protein [Geminicoccaceae bacterium]
MEATPLDPASAGDGASRRGLPPPVARDAADLRRIEGDLRERSRQPHGAQEVARLGDRRFEPDSGRFAWSPQPYRICGLDRATFAPTPDAVFAPIHPTDRRAVRDARRRGGAGVPRRRAERPGRAPAVAPGAGRRGAVPRPERTGLVCWCS